MNWIGSGPNNSSPLIPYLFFLSPDQTFALPPLLKSPFTGAGKEVSCPLSMLLLPFHSDLLAQVLILLDKMPF
jgi:hypothetical protein